MGDRRDLRRQGVLDRRGASCGSEGPLPDRKDLRGEGVLDQLGARRPEGAVPPRQGLRLEGVCIDGNTHMQCIISNLCAEYFSRASHYVQLPLTEGQGCDISVRMGVEPVQPFFIVTRV